MDGGGARGGGDGRRFVALLLLFHFFFPLWCGGLGGCWRGWPPCCSSCADEGVRGSSLQGGRDHIGAKSSVVLACSVVGWLGRWVGALEEWWGAWVGEVQVLGWQLKRRQVNARIPGTTALRAKGSMAMEAKRSQCE
jgi:hypothetical protein